MITFEKINKTCSNIELIDENKCISSSRDVINKNFVMLFDNIQDLKRNFNSYSIIFSNFNEVSANMLSISYNIKSINENSKNALTTVRNLSANWLKPITIYYPRIQDVETWVLTSPENVFDLLQTWLNKTFPSGNYNDNQIIKIYVSTYQRTPFTFSFSRSYYESCGPNVSGSNTVACGQCPDNRWFQQCNITGLGCRNAWSYCQPITPPSTATYKCQGKGAKTLKISYTKTLSDKHFADVYEYNFKNDLNNLTWNQI